MSILDYLKKDTNLADMTRKMGFKPEDELITPYSLDDEEPEEDDILK